IFSILGRGSSSPASSPFARDQDQDQDRDREKIDRLRVTEAVEKAEEWRARRGTGATNERRPKSFLQALKGWMGKTS
ncbi:MAG: hypothetical protein O3C21_18680, partial [Verrucomicrobia bacterium]|nr:hypothetical protein [Verrucomicrobiota bacterium]